MRKVILPAVIFVLIFQLNCFGPDFFINRFLSNIQDHVDDLELNTSQNKKWLSMKSSLKQDLKSLISEHKSLLIKVKKMLNSNKNEKEILSILYTKFDGKDSLVVQLLSDFKDFNAYLTARQQEKLAKIIEKNINSLIKNIEEDIKNINEEEDQLIEALGKFKNKSNFNSKQTKLWNKLKVYIVKEKKKFFTEFKNFNKDLSRKMKQNSISLEEVISEYQIYIESRPTPFQYIIDHYFQFYKLLNNDQKKEFRKYLIVKINDFEDFLED